MNDQCRCEVCQWECLAHRIARFFGQVLKLVALVLLVVIGLVLLMALQLPVPFYLVGLPLLVCLACLAAMARRADREQEREGTP